MADLPHPIIAKAQEMFGSDPDADSIREHIRCAAALALLEVKTGQWRGGVWTDPATGVRWLVATGLAKGDHEDTDDFYKELGGVFNRGRQGSLLPSTADLRLLKLETAYARIANWERNLQNLVTTSLESITETPEGGTAHFEVKHPTKRTHFASIEIQMTPEPGDGYIAEAYVVTIDVADQFKPTELAWNMSLRILTSICPPHQDWDRYGQTMSALAEQGHGTTQIALLHELTERGELCPSVPGTVSHYAHKRNIAEGAVVGTAVRAMCGKFFVPYQDHEGLPVCPDCTEVHAGTP